MKEIQQNVDLTRRNTFRVQSVAEMYAEPATVEDVQSLIAYSKSKNLPIKVLGGGSNLVMMERVSGLVVRYINCDFSILDEADDFVMVQVGGGQDWHSFVMASLEKGWFGLENLALIPGTVGASPVQNIGAYGVEVQQFIHQVNAVDLESGELITLKNNECEFAYRESVFKNKLNGRVLITSVVFRLSKIADVNVSYGPLADRANEEGLPSPAQLAEWVIDVRSSKLPDPEILPNAGSFFKNPVISQAHFDVLQKKHTELQGYPTPDGIKVPAGWLIDRLGFKGVSFGEVSVHEKQALVLINRSGTGEDILNAARKIKERVYQEYGVELEQEPRIFS